MGKRVAITLLCIVAFSGRISAQQVVVMREAKPKIPKADAVAQDRARLQRALDAKTFHVEKAAPVQSVNAPIVQTQPGIARPVIVHAQRQQPVAQPPAKPEVQTTLKTTSPPAVVQVRKAEPAVASAAPPQQVRQSQPAKPEVQTALTTAAPPPGVQARKPEAAVVSTAPPQQIRQSQPAKPEVQTARTISAPPSTIAARKPAPAVASSSPPQKTREPDTRALQSVSLQGATAFTKLANGFDFPIGKPDAQNYYKARGFRSKGHLGEDWDGIRGGDTDLNDPIYCIGDGVVVFARDCHQGWGNVIIVRHAFREGGTVKNIDSLYGHVQKMLVHRGDAVTRGQQIATMGNAHGLYDAHLHLEIRKNIEIGMSRAAFTRDFGNYYDPTQFILAHRRLDTKGGTYRIAMNTFTHDKFIRWDKKKNYSGYRGGGGESAKALKKAVATQNVGAGAH